MMGLFLQLVAVGVDISRFYRSLRFVVTHMLVTNTYTPCSAESRNDVPRYYKLPNYTLPAGTLSTC